MRKLSKKTISIFLSVVLVMGIFSLILPTANFTPNVKAENAATEYDYRIVLNGVGDDTSINDTRAVDVWDSDWNDKQGGINDFSTVGLERLGIWNAMGLDAAWGALGVSKNFFDGTAVGAKADEIHPYIVYNVTPGTSFELSSAVHKEINADEMALTFYASNDGVTWVPINAERSLEGIWKSLRETYDSYNSYVYTIGNVGLRTNFIKVEYPITMTSRLADGALPEDKLLVYGAAFTPVESYAVNGQTLFEAESFARQKELYEKYFIAFPDFINMDPGESTFNRAATTNSGMISGANWGSFDEKDRSYVAMVAPGSHFYLETTNNYYMKTVGEALVANGELESAGQARIRVYSSASLSDDAAWTEWNPMPYSCGGSHTPTFNFYLPENHIYVRIVYPQKGSIATITTKDGAQVVDASGNDAAFFNDMVFTPYVAADADYTYDYTSSAYWNNPQAGTSNLSQDTAKDYGITIPYLDGLNLQNGLADNSNSAYAKGHFSIQYAVEGGKMFNLEYAVRVGSYFIADWPANTKGAYEAEVTDGSSMEMIIETSTDNSTWTNTYETESGYAQTTSSFKDQCYVFDVSYLVPKDANYVRVSFGITGVGVLNYNGAKQFFNDCLWLRKVSVADANNVYTAPAKDSSSGPVEYIYTTDTGANKATSTSNTATGAFDGVTGFIGDYGYLVGGDGNNPKMLAGTLERPYAVYNVIPGSTFSFDFSMDPQAAGQSESSAAVNLRGGLGREDLKEYEFYVYGRADENSSWSYIGKTNSDSLTTYEANTRYGVGSFSVEVPANVNQIKVALPGTGAYTYNEPYTYDYTTATYSDKTLWESWGGPNIGSWNYSRFGLAGASSDQVCYEPAINGVTSTWNQDAWGSKDFYLIYQVNPGSTFIANVKLPDLSKRQSWASQGTTFEFVVSSCATIDGTYSNAVTTEGKEADAVIGYQVPAGCNYVKITFPNKGTHPITNGAENHNAYIKDVTYYQGTGIAAGNDAAYLYNVKYATGIKVDPSAYIYTTDTDANKATSTTGVGVETTANAENNTAFAGAWVHLGGNTQMLAGTKERPYVIYNVIPGTPLTFDFSMRKKAIEMSETSANLNLKGGFGRADLAEFEFFVYGRADENSSWTYIGKTDSDSLSLNGDAASYDTFGFGSLGVDIPANCSQVKIELPQTGGFSAGALKTYDYTTATYSDKTLWESWGGPNIGSWNYSRFGLAGASSDQVCYEPAINGVASTWNQAAWGTKDFYLIYQVKPGTTFVADVKLPALSTRQGWKDAGTTFEFVVSSCATIDGTYSNAVTTEGKEADAVIGYQVPTDCNYVKITFPNKGTHPVTSGAENHNAYIKTVSFYDSGDIMCGNDVAYLYNVKYATGEKPGPDVDYTALNSANITNASKAELNIYHQANTQLEKAAGIKAKADGAFVIYKIKENTMLTVNSGDALSFEYSTDDTNYKPFEAVKTCRGYEIPAIKGRNYIKVKLDNGEAIANAYAEVLTPTVKFYIPYLNKYDLKDVASYGAAANSVSPTINTLRPGYKFEGWTEYDDEGIYIDKTVKAVYTPDADKKYTVSYTVGKETVEEVKLFDNRVTISADATNDKGEVFSKWVDAKGATVSNSRNFSFLVSGNIALKAVYAKTKEDIAPYIYVTDEPIITTNDNGTWNLSVVWRTAMSGDVTVKETGILLGKDVDKAHLILWDGKTQENTYKMKHSNTATNKTAVYTVKNIKADETRTALPYAILSNGDVIYGENVIKVTNGEKVTSTDFEFNGTITPTVLNNYLDRAVSYDVFGTADGQDRDSAIYNARDFVRKTGAKYLARGIASWSLDNNDILSGDNVTNYKNWIAEIHEVDPEVIVEGAIFENVNANVESILIPEWVLKEFGQTVRPDRYFDYDSMLHTLTKKLSSGKYGVNEWGIGNSIPDIGSSEFQMYVYYKACQYIDAGVEAIHFGQMYRIGAEELSISNDVSKIDLASWETVLTKIRDYAKTHARRGYVLVNGHNHTFAFAKENTTQMLVDFTASPLRLVTANSSDAYSESFRNVGLTNSSGSDAAYITKFTGYTTPSGFTVADCYPYLLEFDNFGIDTANLNKFYSSGDHVWGYDEISWYVNQQASDRHIFLTNIVNKVAGLSAAKNGHVALPGKRTAFISATGASEYLTNEANIYNGIIYSTYYKDGAGKYGTYGAEIPLWDAKIAGDVDAIKAAFDSLN